jgi:hypothetical protein
MTSAVVVFSVFQVFSPACRAARRPFLACRFKLADFEPDRLARRFVALFRTARFLEDDPLAVRRFFPELCFADFLVAAMTVSRSDWRGLRPSTGDDPAPVGTGMTR